MLDRDERGITTVPEYLTLITSNIKLRRKKQCANGGKPVRGNPCPEEFIPIVSKTHNKWQSSFVSYSKKILIEFNSNSHRVHRNTQTKKIM